MNLQMKLPAPDSFLPLPESSYYILLSLASSKKHGYAIMKDVEDLSQGDLLLSASTLYTALGRLLDHGLIARTDNSLEEEQGPGLPRKVYTLTHLGRDVLEAEAARLEKLISVTRVRLSQEAK